MKKYLFLIFLLNYQHTFSQVYFEAQFGYQEGKNKSVLTSNNVKAKSAFVSFAFGAVIKNNLVIEAQLIRPLNTIMPFMFNTSIGYLFMSSQEDVSKFVVNPYVGYGRHIYSSDMKNRNGDGRVLGVEWQYWEKANGYAIWYIDTKMQWQHLFIGFGFKGFLTGKHAVK